MASEKGIGLHAAVSLISRQLTSADDEPVVEKVLLVLLSSKIYLIHPHTSRSQAHKQLRDG